MLSQLGLNDDDDETSLTSLIYLQQPIEVPTEDGRCMNSELLDLEVNASVFVSKLDSIFQFYDFVPNSKEVYVQLSLSRVQSKDSLKGTVTGGASCCGGTREQLTDVLLRSASKVLM